MSTTAMPWLLHIGDSAREEHRNEKSRQRWPRRGTDVACHWWLTWCWRCFPFLRIGQILRIGQGGLATTSPLSRPFGR